MEAEKIDVGPHGLREIELYGDSRGDGDSALPKPYEVWTTRVGPHKALRTVVVVSDAGSEQRHREKVDYGTVADAYWDPGNGRLKDAKQFLLDLCNVRFDA